MEGGVRLANGGCLEGQTKGDKTLQTVRSVSEKEHLGALKTKVCLEIIASAEILEGL